MTHPGSDACIQCYTACIQVQLGRRPRTGILTSPKRQRMHLHMAMPVHERSGGPILRWPFKIFPMCQGPCPQTGAAAKQMQSTWH